ncbi:MAG: hypothetical protein RLZZ182_1700 [Pseudomonadota bacterium]|jgi:hypothetical protein
MSITKIALTAGLLAVQAALLALLHAGEARSATVYHCQGQYQQQPCSGVDAGRALEVSDDRHPHQTQSAQRRLRAERRALTRGHTRGPTSTEPSPGIGGLSAHHAGDAPFRNATQLGVGSTLNRLVCRTRNQRLSCHLPDDRIR